MDGAAVLCNGENWRGNFFGGECEGICFGYLKFCVPIKYAQVELSIGSWTYESGAQGTDIADDINGNYKWSK